MAVMVISTDSQYDVKGDASNRRMSDFDVGAGKQHSPVAQKSKPLRRNVSWEERMGEAASALGPAMADAAEGKALSWREFAALSAKMLISNPGGTHDEGVPHVKMDGVMALSCLALFPMALIYDCVGQTILFRILTFLTATSVLSDAVFHNNIFFDLLDRYTATIGVIGISWYAFSWMWLQEPSLIWVVAFPVQLLLLLTPLSFLQKSRSYLIGSQEWRKAHCKWHYVAAVCCSLTALITQNVVVSRQTPPR